MSLQQNFLFISSLICCALLTTSAAHARSQGELPKGCRVQGFGFSNEILTLEPTNESETNQTLYLMQNQSNTQLTLRAHEKQYDLLGMDWSMNLLPQSWSAFALNKSHLEFTCELNGKPTPCDQTLVVCEYNRAVFGDAIFGSYWVVTNKPLQAIVAKSIKNGILLRW